MHLAPFIDHTQLSPTATLLEIDTLCAEAVEHGFAAVCVPPCFVDQAASAVRDGGVRVATVIGFPLGYSTSDTKLHEARESIAAGATELDMVQNLGSVKSGDWEYLHDEAQRMMSLVKSENAVLKIILETAALERDEIIRCCKIYAQLGVHFLKTSTGFHPAGGATVEAVKTLREHLPASIQIKASGGIRTFDAAKSMIEAGATRIGASASVALVREGYGMAEGSSLN